MILLELKNEPRMQEPSVTMTKRNDKPALGDDLDGIVYSCGKLIPLGWLPFRALSPYPTTGDEPLTEQLGGITSCTSPRGRFCKCTCLPANEAHRKGFS